MMHALGADNDINLLHYEMNGTPVSTLQE